MKKRKGNTTAAPAKRLNASAAPSRAPRNVTVAHLDSAAMGENGGGAHAFMALLRAAGVLPPNEQAYAYEHRPLGTHT